MNIEPKIGDVWGTNGGALRATLDPLHGLLGNLITCRTAGPGKLGSPHVAQHVLCVAEWSEDAHAMLVGCEKREKVPLGSFGRPKVPYGTLIGVEATAPRVRWTLLNRYNHGLLGNHAVFKAHPKYLVDDAQEMNSFLWSYVGKRYDWAGLFELAGWGKDSPTKFYCSEIARDVGRKFLSGFPEESKYGFSPFDEQKFFEANGCVYERSYKEFWG